MRRFQFSIVPALLIAVVVTAGGCATTTSPSPSPSRQAEDATIRASLKAKLAADIKLFALTNLDVNSTNGVVTLVGQVDTMYQKRAAGDISRTVEGVARVRNEIQVKSE